MSAHNLPTELFAAGAFAEQRDPGASGTITVFKSPATIPLVSATTETRTLARPTEVGAFVSLYMRTDGGDITVTVTGGYNEDGETTFVFSDPGQFALFQSFYDGSAYYWRKIADYASSNLSPTEAGFLSGVTAGTGLAGKALVLDSSGNVAMPAAPASIDERNAEVVITTNVIAAAENGRTYYLALAAGFTSTLPAPALGLRFLFVVQIAPTGAPYVITTNAGANVIYGMMVERAGGAGVAGAAQDTQNLVHNQSIIGDWVEYVSDGTNWYCHGMVDVSAGTTFAVT